MSYIVSTNSIAQPVIVVDASGNPTTGEAVTIADGADVTQGVTTGAAVTTDANGTIQQYLRGLVVLFVNFLTRLPAALGAGGGLKVDGSGTPLPISGTVTANLGTIGGAATEATLAAQSAKLPASLGIKTSPASLSVTSASDATFPPKTLSTTPTDGAAAAAFFEVDAGANGFLRKLVRLELLNASGTYDLLRGDTKGLYTREGGYSFANITTAATTTVKNGAGVLHTLTVNNLGTVASTTTVYDNTAGSGTKIATINTLAGQESYVYDAAFATGLTIVTTGTVAPDITVTYR